MRKFVFVFILCFLVFSLYPPFGFSDEVKLEVKVSRANVRFKPDLNASVIGNAAQGTTLISKERIGDWFKVDLPPDANGFVVTGYIHLSTVNIIASKSEPVEPPPPADVPEYAQGAPSSGMGFGFRILGGFNYSSGGNISDGFDGVLRFWREVGLAGGLTEDSGSLGSMGMGLGLEADIIINFTKTFGIGIGAGYITAGGKSSSTLSNPGGTMILEQDGTVSAIPLRLSLVLTLPVSDMMSFVADAGGGFYLATYKSTFHLELSPDYTDDQFDTSASGIGFHGGLGLKINFSPNLGLVLMGRGRYAKIKGFEGDWTQTGNSPTMFTPVSGPLYNDEISAFGKTFSYILIDTTIPSGAQEAVFDFSGFGLILGIMVGF